MNELEYEFHNYNDKHLPFNYHFEHFESDMYSPNWHREIEILYVTCGYGLVKINGIEYSFKMNDIIFVNSDYIHHIESSSTLKYHCLQISSDFFVENGIKIDKLNIYPIISSELIAAKYVKAVNAFESHITSPNSSSELRMIARLKIRSYVVNMLADLISAGYSNPHNINNNNNNKSVTYVKQALSYISDNFAHQFSVDDIADKIKISKHHLIREFKKQTGHSILEYRNILRCQLAKRMIQNGSSVTKAATESGFDDVSHFGAIYKKIVGVSPSKTTFDD